MSFTKLYAYTCAALALIGTCYSSEITADSSSCGRQASRDAAIIIESVISRLVHSKGYVLPTACPFNVSLNLFKRQEEHKKMLRKGVWQCEFDKKASLYFLNAYSLAQLVARKRQP